MEPKRPTKSIARRRAKAHHRMPLARKPAASARSRAEANSHARLTTRGLQPAIRVVMMPRDTNGLGTIFGGVILSYIDVAGAVEAYKHSNRRLVTAAMHEIKFIAPVFVGDLVSFYAETVRIGNTSITVRVTVEATRATSSHENVRVTQAEVAYVAINKAGKPVPVRS